MRTLLGLATVFAVTAGMAQEQPPAQKPAEGARELFFFGSAPKDALPPIPKAAPARSKAAPAGQKTAAPAAAQPGAPLAAPAPTAAMHLGIRYTLLLVTSPGDRDQAADPARNFRKGDCMAMNVESNRSGYLYVLAKQSGGDWIPLFPTPDLPDQSNRIDPGQIVRAPRRSCFEIDDPPGTETLFVVLSRNPRDIDDLAAGIKGPGETPQVATSGPTQVASAARINSAVDQIAQEAGTRELPFKEVVKPIAASPLQKAAAKPGDKKEPQHAVYVVSGSSKPASTLVTRVEIHHR